MVDEAKQHISSDTHDISFYLDIQEIILTSFAESNPTHPWSFKRQAYRIIRKRALELQKHDKQVTLTEQIERELKQYNNGRALLHARLNDKAENLKYFNHYASTLFAICASGYSTIMFTQKILIDTFHLSASGPAIPVIISLAIVNIMMDEFIFNIMEDVLKNYYGEDYCLSLDDRELIKFAMLLIIAIVCCTLGYYIIPAALLLFTAGYFVNYMLQINQLGDTVNKIISLFKGRTVFDGLSLSSEQLNLIKTGCFLSIVYAIAMASLAAKWILPVIGGAAFLGSLASPIGIIVCIALIAYGIIYGLLTARGWSNLVLLDARLKRDRGFGLLSVAALKLYLQMASVEFNGYWAGFKENGIEFFANLLIVFLLAIQGKCNAVAAKKCTTIFFNHFLLGTFIFLLKMTRATFRVTLGVLSMYGLFYTLDEGCRAIGSTINSPETGAALTLFNFTAQTPFMLKNAAEIALPDQTPASNKKIVAPLNIFSQMMIEGYRIINAGRNMLIPMGGEMPSSEKDAAIAVSTAAASYTAVKPAADNLIMLQEKMQQKGSEAKAAQQYTKTNTHILFNQWRAYVASKKSKSLHPQNISHATLTFTSI
jgi:hypothetical protein